MSDREAIGDRIRKCRRDAKITQNQLGARLGISHASISNLERGETAITIEYVNRIAEVLGVDSSEILGDLRADSRTRHDEFVHEMRHMAHEMRQINFWLEQIARSMGYTERTETNT